MNAPVKDCAGTYTFLGSKLFKEGAFDPARCAAACDANTKCAAFGTYILTTTDRSGASTVQGQKCAFYTSYWDGKKYGKNTGTYNDSAGTKNTFSSSFFYSRADRQPICKIDTCVAPPVVPGYKDFTPIFGTWENGEIGINNGVVGYGVSSDIELPFSVGIGGQLSSTVTVGVDGYINIAGNTLNAFTGQGGGLYLYGGVPNGDDGLFYRVAGVPGARTVVFSWYAGTLNFGHNQNHFTVTLFENLPGYVQYKYYDIIEDPYPNALIAVQIGGSAKVLLPAQVTVAVGTQVSIYAPGSLDSVKYQTALFNRVDCCTTNTFHRWHVCTEFQPPVADSLAPAHA
jgi:hypothetical protein